MHLLVRISLTALLVFGTCLSYFDQSGNKGPLGELVSIGMSGSLLIIVAFFIMVGIYCRTLQECLTRIRPENRKVKPGSVWFMFAIPFNFVEDFFIVINLANSIEEEKRSNRSLQSITDFGMVSGIGWSIAQVMSFIPNIVGQAAGLVGFILVIYHWLQIAKINRLLSKKEMTF
jgi:hypothetical protein